MIQNDGNSKEISTGVRYSAETMFAYLRFLSGGGIEKTFGKYPIKEELSSTRQSVVLLAFDPDLHREVVLKIYKPDLPQDQKTMILNEGRALSQTQHENIVQCHAAETLDDSPYLVLEFVSGLTLDKLSNLTEDGALEIVRQISEAMEAVHRRGILHLDLKPTNAIVATDGTVKLIDFGLAQPISNVRFGEVSGTPSFMAPEVANQQRSQIDHRTDIFGVGAILHFLLTGKPPFDGSTMEEVVEAARQGDIEMIDAEEYPKSAEICKKCLHKNPQHRYATIAELKAELAKTIPTQPRPVWPWLTLLAALLLISAWFVVGRQNAPPLKLHGQVITALNENFDSWNKIETQNKLGLECTPEVCGSDAEFESFEVPENDVWIFSRGEKKLRLSIKAGQMCYLTIFKIECEPDETIRQAAMIVPYFDSKGNSNDGNVAVKSQESINYTFELHPTKDPEKTEFLVVLARQERWSPKALLDDVFNSPPKQPSSVPRGVKSVAESEASSAIIIPFRVLPHRD